MKKKNLFIATLLVVAATTIAVVSCKKESQTDLPGNSPQPVKTFSPPEVDDMNAYLKDFKQRMQSATRDDESLSLEEAAWHLGSLANADFGYVSTKYDEIRFDTLYSYIAVNNGEIKLSDLNNAYNETYNAIERFYQDFDLDNLHCHFVDAIISEDGQIMVTLFSTYDILSSDWGDTLWYFPDIFAYTDSVFDLYLSEDSVYIWCTIAVTELNRILNILEGRPFVDNSSFNLNHHYYVKTRENVFIHGDDTDPFCSPFHRDSRLFYGMGDGNAHIAISYIHMQYCIDSYLGLGTAYIHNYHSNWDEYPVQWNVLPGTFYNLRKSYIYHDLKVIYGRLVTAPNQGDE